MRQIIGQQAMEPERWRQIEQLYHSVLEREPNDRSAFLAAACAGDEELRAKVEYLVAQSSSTGLIQPFREAAADLLDTRVVLTPGTRLGPYEIVSLLGTGGMGQVYKAFDARLRREVAIKVAGERFSERFAREARAVAALNHPNICTVHDVGPNYLLRNLLLGPC
jgi:eukaryotic-like serine/threonine-protein kinase